MFGIISNGNLDNELFNKMYLKEKDVIDNLIFYMENFSNMLEIKLEEYGYEKISEILNFLDNCKDNYTTFGLKVSLEEYLNRKKDELFLNLYLANQDGNVETWLNSLSLSELMALRSDIENDASFVSVFPDLYSAVSKKINHI